MNFGEVLSRYITELECSPSELAHSAGLSTALISRYLNGKRQPRKGSRQLQSLINGIAELSQKKGKPFDSDEAFAELTATIDTGDVQFESFVDNFNQLINELKLNTSNLAHSMSYNASFISRIKNGTRRPADLADFTEKIANYIAGHYTGSEDKALVAGVIGCDEKELDSTQTYKKCVEGFLLSYQEEKSPAVEGFLEMLNSFSDNSEISGQGKFKIPTTPIMPSISKVYYGVKGMQEAEKDFFKYTLIGKSKNPVLIYSDIPMNEVDDSRQAKLIYAVTALINKGIHLNLIHTVNRPMKEMLLGLEVWIPIYMTGLISPYYFESTPSAIFSTMLATSGSAALVADCEKGKQSNTRLTVTTKREDVDYFNRRAEYMISKSKPLMRIYTQENEAELSVFLESERESAEFEIIRKPQLANIEFTLCDNKWIMLKKLATPSISFVIFNNQLRKAIENYISN